MMQDPRLGSQLPALVRQEVVDFHLHRRNPRILGQASEKSHRQRRIRQRCQHAAVNALGMGVAGTCFYFFFVSVFYNFLHFNYIFF